MREKRKLEIEELISKLDLTPAMHQNAVKKYEALRDYLKSIDEDIVFHPHGSFSIGTTVRPYKEQQERNYDLDSICLFNKNKEKATQVEVRDNLKRMLERNEDYSSKLDFYDRCITINYADYGSLGFNIDVVPSALTTTETKKEMLQKGCKAEYVDTAIEISEVKQNGDCNWISSNPLAYVEWFNEINKPFADVGRIERKRRIFEGNQSIYNSVEEVPEYFNKTSLQMAIQLLKRARDVHFSKLGKEKESLKPISAIISTIVLDTANRKLIPYDADVLQVISIVLEELKVYSKYQKLTEADFRTMYFSKVTISKNNGKWEMWNPVNPIDNLVDSWNDVPECAKLFFDWVATLDKTIIEILDDNNVEYTRSIGNIIGNTLVEDYYKLTSPRIIDRGPKPWKLK
jgi:hypothetical protein